MPSRVEIDKVTMEAIERRLEGSPEYFKGFAAYMSLEAPKTTVKYLGTAADLEKYIGKSCIDMTMDDLNKYFGWVRNGKGRNKPGSQSLQQTTYYGINKFFSYLKKSGKIKENPMDGIDAPKVVKKVDKREVPEEWVLKEILREVKLNADIEITRLELKGVYVEDAAVSNNPSIREVFRALRKQALRWAVLTVYITTGIRSIELRTIDMKDVDFEAGVFRVVTKGSDEREIQFGQATAEALKVWMGVRNALVNVKSDALFVNAHGNRLGSTYAKDVLKEILEDLNMTGMGITPHRLRAAYGTHLYDKTRDIYFVQSCMGHASPATTEIYAKHKENPTKKASDIMEELLF